MGAAGERDRSAALPADGALRTPPSFILALAGSAAFLNLYATQPLLPLLQRAFGATRFGVGLTITAPTMAVAIAAPFVGRFADRVGLRRVIVGSAFLLAATTGAAAAATSLEQLIAWRFLQGIATPGIFAGTIAYIYDMWTPERAGRATAVYMTGTIVGGFTGRAVAGVVATDASWHVSFLALGAMTLAVSMALLAFLPRERSPRRAAVREGSAALRHHLRNPRLVATYAIGFCVLFTNVAAFTYIPFYLAAPPFRLGTVALGWLFGVYLVGAVVTPLGGRWIDRYGHRFGIASAMAIGGAGAFLTLAPSLAVIIAGLAFVCTGVFIAQTATSSYIGAVTTHDRALAVGMYSTCYYLGGSAGGAAPSLVWNVGGWPACVALIAAVQALGAFIALRFWRVERGRP